jgi:hypothetical protein
MDCLGAIDESLTILADLAASAREHRIPSQIEHRFSLQREKGSDGMKRCNRRTKFEQMGK